MKQFQSHECVAHNKSTSTKISTDTRVHKSVKEVTRRTKTTTQRKEH